MRKAVFGLILAASALTPAAAIAQHHDHGGNDHGERGARFEARVQNQGQRQAPQVQRQAPQVQVQRQAPQAQARPQSFQRQGGNFQGNRGNWQGRGNVQGNRTQQVATPQAVTPRGYRGGGGRTTQGRPGSIYPQAWQGNPNDPRLRHYQQLEQRNQYRNGTAQQRQEIRRYGNRGGRNWSQNWNRGWRGDRRYNWQGYRAGNRGLFHLSPYYSPYRNWHYRRFSIGLFLDPLFYGQSYWIGDPFYYRLPPAPPGTQWVRYYNDVLLVDIYTGEVVDAIYDFFW